MKTTTQKITCLAITLTFFFSTAFAQNKQVAFENISVQSGKQWLGKREIAFKKVMLNWNLDATIAVRSVEVEASFDMINFNTVSAGVQAVSDDAKCSYYLFEDASPALNNHPMALYRVKIIDAFGRTSYTATKLVSLKS